MEALKNAKGVGLKEVMEKYPLEDFGLTKEDIDEVNNDISRLGKLKRMV